MGLGFELDLDNRAVQEPECTEFLETKAIRLRLIDGELEMTQIQLHRFGGTLLLILLIVRIPVCGQTRDDDKWQFTVAAYLVLPGMSGTIGARGLEVDVNASISDVLSNLQIGFNGYFGARKGNWGFGTDFVYAALGGSGDFVNVDPSEALITLVGMRRLSPGFDLTFGARVNAIRNRIEFKENPGPVLEGRTVEVTKQWVDPLVGFHWTVPLGKRFQFTLPANIADSA
jgi:hypothetical protein